MTKASELDPDRLAWVWAYREQLKLLDLFDAEGLHCAETKWEVESWREFLLIYGLMRGRHAALRDKSEIILAALTPLFGAPLPRTDIARELTRRWLEGVGEVGTLVRRRKDGTHAVLLSMTSKLLWFYQPQEMTMFDTYAFDAIRQSNGFEKLEAKEFLFAFEEVFTKKKGAIIEAAEFSDRNYPYLRRVLDKRLWLQGSGREDKYLRLFKWSLERAPLPAK